jgi:hypothetical protein
MSNTSKSLFSLTKHNNGYFKSEKQAKYLLDMCQESNVFVSAGECYGNSYIQSFIMDEKGVVEIRKSTKKAETITWSRNPDHHEFLEQQAEIERRRIQAIWINKARALINRFDNNSTSILLKIIEGATQEELKKAAELYHKWNTKMRNLEAQVDKIEFG